jgi:hypothetical protein
VLRPGGRAVVVAEPIEGAWKARGLRNGLKAHHRDDHIHEDPISMKQWNDAIGRSGLRGDFFVPAWFMQQVATASSSHKDLRFRGLARMVGPLMQRSTIQDVTRAVGRIPAQGFSGWRSTSCSGGRRSVLGGSRC